MAKSRTTSKCGTVGLRNLTDGGDIVWKEELAVDETRLKLDATSLIGSTIKLHRTGHHYHPCLRNMDLRSQRLLRGESLFLTRNCRVGLKYRNSSPGQTWR